MICKIEHFSECEFPETSKIQINDELKEGSEVYINKEHTLIIEHVINNKNKITIIDGSKILKLKRIDI